MDRHPERAKRVKDRMRDATVVSPNWILRRPSGLLRMTVVEREVRHPERAKREKDLMRDATVVSPNWILRRPSGLLRMTVDGKVWSGTTGFS